MQCNLVAGAYVNYVSNEGDAFAPAPYGPNHGRLVCLKNKYESTDFFRMNNNISQPKLQKRC